MMAANRTLRYNPGTVEGVIHRVNRIMDGIHRIIRIIMTSLEKNNNIFKRRVSIILWSFQVNWLVQNY